jgi:GNAT superfamily N-acetyltransferase/disulfide oxidoreductase YuzD
MLKFSTYIQEKLYIPSKAETLKVPRDEMHQIDKKDMKDFVNYLNSKKIKVTKTIVNPKKLKAIQGEFDKDKVQKGIDKIKSGKELNPIIVSNDGYVIDGNHRWLAALNSDIKIAAIKVKETAKKILKVIKEYPKVFIKSLFEGFSYLLEELKADIKTNYVSGKELAKLAGDKLNADLTTRIKYFYWNPSVYKQNHIVALDGKKIVGIVSLEENPYRKSEIWVMFVSVDKDYYNLGLAKRMLEGVYEQVKKEGKYKVIEFSSYSEEGKLKLPNTIKNIAGKYPSIITKTKIEESVALQELRRVRLPEPTKTPEVCYIITPQQMKAFEQFVDNMFKKFNMDFDFTKHFRERMSDSRNSPCIDIKELAAMINKIYKKKASGDNTLSKHKDTEIVLKDMQSMLNMPVALEYDRKKDELRVAAKTIMRKRDFSTPNPIVKI